MWQYNNIKSQRVKVYYRGAMVEVQMTEELRELFIDYRSPTSTEIALLRMVSPETAEKIEKETTALFWNIR